MWRGPAGGVPSWCCITRPARWIACPSTTRWPTQYDVLVPHHPGYSRSERPEWMRSVRDIAVIYRGLLSDLKLSNAALVGLGFGGWIAAEMATMAPADLSRLVLVGAMGIKPPQGDILDLAVTLHRLRPRRLPRPEGVRPRLWRRAARRPARDVGHLPRDELPHRLEALHVQPDPAAPAGRRARAALVVWGDDDRIVPLSAGKSYAKALPNARLEIVKASGHCVDMEQPEALAKLVTRLHRSGVIAMHLMYFTEQPMSAYSEEAGRDFGATALMFSNKHFDPVAGAGSTTTTSSNTCWPRRSASTASC